MFLQYHRTPLHTAAENGNTDVVKALLEGKAEIDIQDRVSYCMM